VAEDLRLYADFFHHPKTQMLRRRLGGDGVLALLQLWTAATDNYRDGDLGGKSDEFIEVAAGWTGEAGALTKSLREIGFLDGEELDSSLHDWGEYQPWVAGVRAHQPRLGRENAMRKWHGDEVKRESNRTRSERLKIARQKGTHTEEEWHALVEICGPACLRCKKPFTQFPQTVGVKEGVTEASVGVTYASAVVKDHIVPLYTERPEASDSIENLQPLCKSCSSGKGSETKDFRPVKWREQFRKRLPDACEMPAECVLPNPNPTLRTTKSQDAGVPVSPPADSADWEKLHATIAAVGRLASAKAMDRARPLAPAREDTA